MPAMAPPDNPFTTGTPTSGSSRKMTNIVLTVFTLLHTESYGKRSPCTAYAVPRIMSPTHCHEQLVRPMFSITIGGERSLGGATTGGAGVTGAAVVLPSTIIVVVVDGS